MRETNKRTNQPSTCTATALYTSLWPVVLTPLAYNGSTGAPPAWTLVATVIVALGALVAAFAWGQARYARRNQDVLEAGRRALDRASDPADTTAQTSAYPAHAAASPAADINREMEADLALARDFQLAYLNRPYPNIPETHYEGHLRLKFHHWYNPALALGGDFFDIMPLASDTAGVFIADVMGHGARSALITAILRTLLRDLKGQGRNARHYITQVNKSMCEIMRGFPQPLFASAFYFVPDTTSRVATFSTAGHPAPFHVRRSLGRLTRLSVPSPHGAALGIIPDESYTGGHIRLIDNDGFIFFTDGAYEAANAEGEEFGLSRMIEVIRACLYKDGPTIVKNIETAIRRFAGDTPLSDDICIVAVDVTTQSEETAKDV